MTRPMIHGLALASTLLALTACKDSKTAADAAAADGSGVRLLDKGQRPRSALRYSVSAGTTTSSTTTFRVASLATSETNAALTILPGLRLDIVSGPAELTELGVKFKVDVVRSEAVVPDDYDQDLADQLRGGAALAESIGGWVELDDRGQLLAGALNEQTKRSDIPVRLIRMIVNSRETLTRVRLPEEKVGLGARWESRRQIKAYGFNLQQVDTYTLVDRVGDEVMLNVTVQQMARPQTIEFPEEEIAISVQSMTSQADGQIILDLRALESDASANGTAEDHLLVKTAKGAESIDIKEEFEVQVANTTSLGSSTPVPDDTKARRRDKRR
ncbi:MAG: hypothetical protein OEN21_09365 [Myxococcales bacterium]|nr:hypothetical protein [Myxococcales bacterium]